MFGLIRIAGLCAALPVSAIREVVPCPPELEPFPASRPDIVGALELRGEVIPVIDLASALSKESVDGDARQSDDRSIIVILRQEQHVFAALADGIIGVMPLTTREISPLSQAATDEGVRLFSSTFRVAVHNGVVLDPAAIIELPGMVTARRSRSSTPCICWAMDRCQKAGEAVLALSYARNCQTLSRKVGQSPSVS
ncbi:MAG: chemotaxis protein CheW [Novosphingobium sp.]